MADCVSTRPEMMRGLPLEMGSMKTAKTYLVSHLPTLYAPLRNPVPSRAILAVLHLKSESAYRRFERRRETDLLGGCDGSREHDLRMT